MKPLFAFLSVLLIASGAWAQMPLPPRTVSVAGEAKEEVMPDQVIVSVSLVNKDKELRKAKSDNDAQTERLLAITRDFKIAKDKVSTSRVNISPDYTYDNGKRRFEGYTVSRSLRITLDTVDLHERLMAALVDAKVDQVDGVEFRLADPEPRVQALRIKAFENAKARAEGLAKAAGAKLGPAIVITTDGVSSPRPMIMDGMMEKAAFRGAGVPSAAPTIPGMMTLMESVSVTFALE